MASFVYDNAKEQLLLGTIDFSTDDIRIALLMTNTTADTVTGAATVADFTPDDFDGNNYVAGGAALASEAVSEDTGNNAGKFTASNLTFSSMGAGTRNIQGHLLYKFVTNFNSSIPIAWVDTGGYPVTANGGDIVISHHANGILQTT